MVRSGLKLMPWEEMLFYRIGLIYHLELQVLLVLILLLHENRIIQLESAGGSSGGRNAARNQIYNMITVTGDAVFIEFISSPSTDSWLSATHPKQSHHSGEADSSQGVKV